MKVLLLFSALAVFSFDVVENAVFDISPNDFIPGLSLNVTMRCELGPLAQAVSSILAMQIEKEEGGQFASLATFQFGSKPTLSGMPNGNKWEVEGAIDPGHLDKAYLQLRLNYPEVMDAGHYVCSVTLMDMASIIKTTEFGSDLTTVPVTNSTLLAIVQSLQKDVRSLLDERIQLNKTITDLVEQNNNLTARLSIPTCPTSCMDEIDAVSHNLSHVASQARENEDMLNKVNNMVTFGLASSHTPVAFAVRYHQIPGGEKTVDPKNHTIIFNEELVNVGNHYDLQTGDFTVPTDGTYIFTLCLPIKDNDPGRLFNIALVRDYFHTISQIQGGVSYNTQSSMTVMYHLTAKQTVSAFIEQVSGPPADPNNLPTISVPGAHFAGFLLR